MSSRIIKQVKDLNVMVEVTSVAVWFCFKIGAKAALKIYLICLKAFKEIACVFGSQGGL